MPSATLCHGPTLPAWWDNSAYDASGVSVQWSVSWGVASKADGPLSSPTMSSLPTASLGRNSPSGGVRDAAVVKLRTSLSAKLFLSPSDEDSGSEPR